MTPATTSTPSSATFAPLPTKAISSLENHSRPLSWPKHHHRYQITSPAFPYCSYRCYHIHHHLILHHRPIGHHTSTAIAATSSTKKKGENHSPNQFP
ncbi:uncharacterized protein M6B38_357835 [Iris pallida]|uniref:Proline-rich receptor-like protein kinase PERK3 n=1 Tax=Iris pallida TaxID=29817 RepID=A0AAX6F856_IRIPA|nr:putative proline-rich receptor-like protein kinase PERK3 [Iris pallida]KAJ6829501.1 uncharacterized protein M6B38_357835 [Iris pallida]